MSIKTIIFATAAATTLGLLTPMAATAQRGGGNLPNGSYAQSCSNAYVSNGRLYAECRDTRRGTRSTSIEIAPCAGGEIGNDNGLLICGAGRGRFESSNGGGNNGGGWGGGNGNGNGNCNGGNNGGWGNNGGGNNGGGWGGGQSAITVYRDSNFRGPSQSFSGEVSDLRRSGFNDAISSMELRGTWEACTNSNFRGQCMQFDGEVSDLVRWRLNDTISSLRPVRGGRR